MRFCKAYPAWHLELNGPNLSRNRRGQNQKLGIHTSTSRNSDLAILVHIWLGTLHADITSVHAMLKIKARFEARIVPGSVPNVFHLLPEFTFRLLVSNTHLLEVDIGGVKDSTRVPSIRTFFTQKVVQRAGAKFLALWICLRDLPQETSFSDIRFSKTCSDLFPDLVCPVS